MRSTKDAHSLSVRLVIRLVSEIAHGTLLQ